MCIRDRVLGGAASGKSGYAESLVLKTALPRYYIATMQVWDAECAARVEKHRRMRAAKQFETVECPLHLENIHLSARGTALLEDLGNLTANELYDPAGAGENAASDVYKRQGRGRPQNNCTAGSPQRHRSGDL